MNAGLPHVPGQRPLERVPLPRGDPLRPAPPRLQLVEQGRLLGGAQPLHRQRKHLSVMSDAKQAIVGFVKTRVVLIISNATS